MLGLALCFQLQAFAAIPLFMTTLKVIEVGHSRVLESASPNRGVHLLALITQFIRHFPLWTSLHQHPGRCYALPLIFSFDE